MSATGYQYPQPGAQAAYAAPPGGYQNQGYAMPAAGYPYSQNIAKPAYASPRGVMLAGPPSPVTYKPMGSRSPVSQMRVIRSSPPPALIVGAPRQVPQIAQPRAIPMPLSMGTTIGGIRANVMQIAGCLDSQQTQDIDTSGLPEVQGPARAGGACTMALKTVLDNRRTKGIPCTYRDLLVEMQQILSKDGYSQMTQLSSSKPINLSQQVNIRPQPYAGGRMPVTKALLIGINYVGQPGALDGCHNDVKKMKEFIKSNGFSIHADSIRELVDDGKSIPPTKANIWGALRWLIQDAQPGDSLFLQFSGHGGQVPDLNGDEASGFDQTMVPVDYKTAGMIVDDDILADVVKPLPLGVNMFCIMDCCHSGTIMDLPYFITVDANTGRALAAGEMAALNRNQVFVNKGKKRDITFTGVQDAFNERMDGARGMMESQSCMYQAFGCDEGCRSVMSQCCGLDQVLKDCCGAEDFRRCFGPGGVAESRPNNGGAYDNNVPVPDAGGGGGVPGVKVMDEYKPPGDPTPSNDTGDNSNTKNDNKKPDGKYVPTAKDPNGPDPRNVRKDVTKKNATSNIPGHLSKFRSEYGDKACQIIEWLYDRHAMVDPAARPNAANPFYEVYTEEWDPWKEGRDMHGEGQVGKLAKIIQASGSKFVDPTFPPDNTSLFHNTPPKEFGNEETSFRTDQDPFLAGKKGIEWKRPSEIFPNKRVVVFSGTVHQNDVGQGSLGDCYHIAAISALGIGECDALVQDLVIEDFGDSGIYGVKHFMGGRWVTVIIDDLFPCIPWGGGWMPIFVSPKEHADQVKGEAEIWPMLFEKAWAKIQHSFQALEGGQTYDSCNYLTGGITNVLWDSEKEQAPDFDKLLRAVGGKNPNEFLSCGLHHHLNPDQCKRVGLITGHAYSINQAARLNSGEELIQIRNPWGSDTEWKGAWRDDDPKWTDSAKQQVGFVSQHDGSCWMEMKDFVSYFDALDSCDPVSLATLSPKNKCVVSTMACAFVAGKTAGGTEKCSAFSCNPTAELTISRAGKVWFGVYQPDKRVMGEDRKKEPDMKIGVSVFLIDDGGPTKEVVDGNQHRRVCMACVDMRPGTYKVRAACQDGPGIEGVVWVTVAGQGATLTAIPQKTPSPAQEGKMKLRSRIGGCIVCGNVIKGSFYTKPDGKMCVGCFKCRKCGKPINGQHYPKEDGTAQCTSCGPR